jgi:hypothetical protein
MVATKSTFETTFRTVYWKEGKDKDPVPAGERITPLVAAFPKVLQDEVDATEDIPSGTGRTLPRSLNVAWGAVVSVNPDVMIVTIRKQAPRGAPVEAYPFEAWVSWPANDARGEELQRRATRAVVGGDVGGLNGTRVSIQAHRVRERSRDRDPAWRDPRPDASR